MFDFDRFLDTLKTDLGGVIEEFGRDLKDDILKDTEAFARKTRNDLERWGKQVVDGDLSPEDLEFLVKSKKDLAEMEALKQKGLTQAKLDKLKADILDTVAGSLRKVL